MKFLIVEPSPLPIIIPLGPNNSYYYLIIIIPIALFINKKRASYSNYFELCRSQQKR